MLMRKKFLSILLALAMCLSLMPTAAFADGETGGTSTLGEKLTLEAVASDPYGYDGEGRQKLTDGDTGTKWCFTFPSGGAYVILEADSAVTISGYSFMTGNDNASNTGRNPKSWTLYGSDSQDGDWTEITSVTDDTTMQDQNSTKFDFVLTTVPAAYQYYKFAFTANQGAKAMQLSEIALYGSDCEHEWQNEGDAVAVTCTTDGYQLQKCSKCGSTKRVDIVRATGHDYGGPKCTKCNHVCCAALTTAGNDVSYFENIEDALNKARNYDGCTVKLYSKATYDKQFDAYGSTFTIDLNGQQAAFRLMISYNSNITIINTADTQAIFGGDSIDDPVVYAHDGTVTVGRSDGSDGDILFRSKDNTGSSNETFKIYKYSKPYLYGGSYMGITCDESAKLYNYLPARFAFADSAGNEVNATGNTLSEVHIVRHTEHQKDGNGFCTICGACDHPADKVDGSTFQCSQCGKTMLAHIKLGENVTYFSDLNEAIQKAAETDGCTLKLLADAGALTVSAGAFTLNLKSKTVNSLTVSGGSVKLTNAKKIETLTVSGNVTLASLLPEGYTFYNNSWYRWYSTDDLVEKTSLSDVSVRQIPLKDLTLTADKESYVYGDDITLTASVTKVGEWGSRYSWYEGKKSLEGYDNTLLIEKPTAGEHTYTCTVKTDNDYRLSTTISVTVDKADLSSATVTLAQNSFVYDGAAKTPTVFEVKLGETTLTSADYDVTVTPQTNVGSGYTVTVTGKGNCTGTASASWSITKADGSVTAPTAKTNLVYNGEAQTLITAGASTTGTIQYKLDNGEYGTALPEATNAGTYTVWYKVVGDENHKDVAENSVSVTIAKKQITVPDADRTEFTYNGEAQTYKLALNDDYTISDNVTQTNANKVGYTITVSLKDKVNTVWANTENDTAAKTYQFVIHKAKATVTAKDKTAYIGGTAPDLSKPEKDKDYTISGLFGKDTLTGDVELAYEDAPDMTKAGEAAIKIGGTLANDNYIIDYVSGKLTITTRPSSGGDSSDDVKTTTDSETSEKTTGTTAKDSKTETVKNEQGEDISKVTAKVSDKVADKLVDEAVSNKSDNVEITVKSKDGNKAGQTEIEIPKKAIDSIAKNTDADLVIKTDNGQIAIDNKALGAMAASADGDTLRIVVTANMKLKEAQKPAADAIGNTGGIFDVSAYIGNTRIYDLKDGKAEILLPVPENLKDKNIAVIYISDKGICEIISHTVETGETGSFVKFTTSQFANYAIVEKANADKLIEKQNTDKINSLIREAKLKATTSKTSKKNVKIKVSVKNNSSLIKEAKANGYTVKYKFYKSTKKASMYKAVKTKTSNSYINTKGKKGTKYYYKAKVMVYDGKKLVTQTELKQCSYGARRWSK